MEYTGARILIESLIEQGVDTVFGYPGSAVLSIYDELYKQRKRIRHILVSHEQHAAHAADGYARSTGRPGVCIATSGPGATNLITGIAAAYMDSVPLVAITGNVPTGLLGKDSFQEVDIAGISMPVVKHNWIVKDVKELAEVIREAFIVAVSGRPGPVLIDIPQDVTVLRAKWVSLKGAEKKKRGGTRAGPFLDRSFSPGPSLAGPFPAGPSLDRSFSPGPSPGEPFPERHPLSGFSPAGPSLGEPFPARPSLDRSFSPGPSLGEPFPAQHPLSGLSPAAAQQDPGTNPALSPLGNEVLSARAKRLSERNRRPTFTDDDIARAAALLEKARRPLLYAGGGVICAGAGEEIAKLAERLNAPVAVSLMGIGAVPRDHRLYTGLIGMHGTVASNKAAQKADLLFAAGARFSDRVTSRADMFAKTARVIHFDIDPAEINKNIETHAWVVGNLKETLGRLLEKLPPKMETEWKDEIERWKTHIPQTGGEGAASSKNVLRPRFIIEETAKKLGPRTIAVTDVGQHQIWAAQFFPAAYPRSFLSSGGLGSMGFGLGAALGAKIANPEKPVVLFTGDGCFKMNCSEMATLSAHKIPVMIVVFHNGVLGMVRQWQSFFYEKRWSETDLSPYPDFIKLSGAYGITGFRATDRNSFLEALTAAAGEMANGRAALIEARIDKNENVLPMVPSGRPIDEQIL